MKFTLFITTLLLFTGIYGCKKNVIEPVEDHSSKYIPMNVGNKWTYQMDSIVYSGFSGSTPDSFHYFIQDEIKEKYTSVQDNPVYRVERSFRLDSNDAWTFARQFSLEVTDHEVLKTDFDQLKVMFSFPVLLDKTWNSNQYNLGRDVETYYDSVHTPMQIGSNQYDSTCLVHHDEEKNIINSFFINERYAANVGLVEREEERMNFVGTATQVGFKYKLTLIAFESN